jgi:hypothetical protein
VISSKKVFGGFFVLCFVILMFIPFSLLDAVKFFFLWGGGGGGGGVLFFFIKKKNKN